MNRVEPGLKEEYKSIFKQLSVKRQSSMIKVREPFLTNRKFSSSTVRCIDGFDGCSSSRAYSMSVRRNHTDLKCLGIVSKVWIK